MNHLGPADDHRTEARRERSKKSPPPRRGRRKDRPPAKDCATTSLEDLEAPRTSIVGFGRRNDDGDESERALNTNGRNEHAGWTCGDEGVEEKSGKRKKKKKKET